MASKIQELAKQNLISPPGWLPNNVAYETIMGSYAYGVSSDTSDMDIYGFCIPPKDMIFPHLRGEIPGFGTQKNRFEQYQEQHIQSNKHNYDLSMYSIVKYFHLCMENNPNMVDSLFTPANCVVFSTKIGQLVRENRKLFLHKGYYHKARGYAYSQISKIVRHGVTGKRKELVETYGYGTKFAYHIVRLLDQTEQVLVTGDLDLTRSRDVLIAIRQGAWSEERIREYFAARERELEDVYHKSTVPYKPDEGRIKGLLLACLEDHYGSLSNMISTPDKEKEALIQIHALVKDALGWR